MLSSQRFSSFLNRLIDVPSTDPDDARRRKILNTILVFVAGLTLILMISMVFNILLGNNDTEVTELLLISIVLLIGTGLLYLMNRVVSGWAASGLFLLFLMVVFAYSDAPPQLVDGRSLFVFTIPIIMASMLLSPSFSFVIAAAVTLEIWVIINLNDLPRILNPVAVAVFFMVAAISWLSARSLETALRELRIINADLDQVVAQRTQALAESLSRERIEAGQNQAILNSIADGVIVFDTQWRAILANPAIKIMLDMPLQSIINHSFQELIENPNLTPRSRTFLNAMIEQDTQPFSFRIDWGTLTLSVSAAQVYDKREEGSVNIGTVIVFRDFTKEAEVERLKSTFVAMVSHELRTPLNAILGYGEMFRESVYGPMNEKQVNTADRIVKNTERLLGLINDLLDQAQMEAGKLTINMAPLKPAELIESLHGVLDKIASDKKLKLTSDIDSALPENLIGDHQRLQQILVNLVNNAIKFTDQGGVNVRLFLHQSDQWGIEVTDTGRGIPQAEIPFIFDTFRQVEGTATRTKGGFGLGLAIVKQLVTLMNGEIKVTSEMEKGTTFSITLPLAIP